jgi:hypothetical protein
VPEYSGMKSGGDAAIDSIVSPARRKVFDKYIEANACMKELCNQAEMI